VTLALRQPTEDARTGQQLYVLDLVSGQTRALLVDAAYDHAAFTWDPEGRWLAMERAAGPRPNATEPYDARTQVWTYDRETETLVRLASAAFQPRWVR
jgi:hypothetical protein